MDAISSPLAQRRGRLSLSFVVSLGIDVLILTMLLFAKRGVPSPAIEMQDTSVQHLVWLTQAGPGGGGGGGGNRMKEPPRSAELPGRDKLTVPVVKAPAPEPEQTRVEPKPIEPLNIPVRELASAADALPGVIEAPPGAPTVSQGAGSGGGAGLGSGRGVGPGVGSGLGPGSGGGTGGGVYHPGNGVSDPILLREVPPAYTSDAMRARIQGAVIVECVVRPDGSVGDVKVTRSLDSVFGLDLEAIKAARQWRFRPGMRLGAPVAVLITIELDFALR